MRSGFIFFIVSVLVIISCSDRSDQNQKGEDIKPRKSKYGVEFNNAVDSLMSAYYAMSEAFVQWDSTGIVTRGRTVDDRIKLVSLEEIKNSPERFKLANLHLFRMQAAILDITGSSDITAKRHRLHDFGEAMYDLLNTIKYDRGKIYLQECTMPFNDTGRGVWLSRTEERRNPYLGLYHPYYKDGMLVCGSTEGTIDYTAEDK